MLTLQQIADKLEPALGALGFSRRENRTVGKLVLSVRFWGDQLQEFCNAKPACEIYADEITPNENGEVVLYVWNWLRKTSPAEEVARMLNERNIPARVRSHVVYAKVC